MSLMTPIRVTIQPVGRWYALRGEASRELLTGPRFPTTDDAADEARGRGWVLTCEYADDPACCGSPEECARR